MSGHGGKRPGAGPPRKGLAELVRDRTWRIERHADLLETESLAGTTPEQLGLDEWAWGAAVEMQQAYARSQWRQLASNFGRLLREHPKP